jgi:hypothetical protein
MDLETFFVGGPIQVFIETREKKLNHFDIIILSFIFGRIAPETYNEILSHRRKPGIFLKCAS